MGPALVLAFAVSQAPSPPGSGDGALTYQPQSASISAHFRCLSGAAGVTSDVVVDYDQSEGHPILKRVTVTSRGADFTVLDGDIAAANEFLSRSLRYLSFVTARCSSQGVTFINFGGLPPSAEPPERQVVFASTGDRLTLVPHR